MKIVALLFVGAVALGFTTWLLFSSGFDLAGVVSSWAFLLTMVGWGVTIGVITDGSGHGSSAPHAGGHGQSHRHRRFSPPRSSYKG